MQALSTARRLDWAGWFLGLWTSAVSGGAGAVAGALGPMLTKPEDFNFGAGLHSTLISMAVGFGLTGLVSLAKFLQTHPAPDIQTVEVTHTVKETTEVKTTPATSPETK